MPGPPARAEAILAEAYRLVFHAVRDVFLAEIEQGIRTDAVGSPTRSGVRSATDVPIRGLVARATGIIQRSVDEQTGSILRIDPASMVGIAGINAFREQAVSLVKDAGAKQIVAIDRVLAENRGLHVGGLIAKIQEATGVADAKARLWARDRTLKLNAAITKERHLSLGITSYVWTTSSDERVRETHAELADRTFEYADPPIIDGQPVNPGEDYQCRCIAYPVSDSAGELDPRQGGEENEEAATREEGFAAASLARAQEELGDVEIAISRGAKASGALGRARAAVETAEARFTKVKLSAEIRAAPVLKHEALQYLRTGMRAESLEFAARQLEGGDPTTLALAREPIVVDHYLDGTNALSDGRHRLAAAQKAGARAIRVTERWYREDGSIRRTRTRIMKIDRSTPVVSLSNQPGA
jgi:SPP1 gp7 family putative phage head morphogenesis protein